MIGRSLERCLVPIADRVERALLHPEAAQRRAFHHLRATLRGAELASAAGFADCRDLEDVRHLPVTDADALRPHLQQAFARGDGRAFGRSPLLAFGRTSGTAGAPKDIPLTRAYLAALDRTLLRLVASYLVRTRSGAAFVRGRHVLLGSRPLIETSAGGPPVVDISGLIPTRTWRLLRRRYLPRHRDLWIPAWSERAERTLDLALDRDVTAISGIPALARDFARRARARRDGALLDELWPNLRLYVFGAAPLPGREREALLRDWFRRGADHELHFVETYFATEGALAFGVGPARRGLALELREQLFTFREQPSDRTALLAHELERSKRYLLHVTTPGGLVNYAMGDWIEVVSERPLRIRPAGRERDEISLSGEKITLEQLRLAVGAVTPGATDFVAWKDEADGRPRLVWGFPEERRPELTRAGPALDLALRRCNHLYDEALALERVIAPCALAFLPAGALEAYARRHLGVGQFKGSRLFTSRAALEAALGCRPRS